MARIRTIKPMFWTDAAIVSLPFEYRLLFIGLWNFADDDGFIVNDAKQIRMWVFPADDVDIAKGIRELAKHSLIDSLTLTESGRKVKVLRIRGWKDHQVISRATRSKWLDAYEEYQAQRATHGGLHESHGAPRGTPSGREGKGRERKGKDITQVGGGTHLSSGASSPTTTDLAEPYRCAKHQGVDVKCYACRDAKAAWKSREASQAQDTKTQARRAELIRSRRAIYGDSETEAESVAVIDAQLAKGAKA